MTAPAGSVVESKVAVEVVGVACRPLRPGNGQRLATAVVCVAGHIAERVGVGKHVSLTVIGIGCLADNRFGFGEHVAADVIDVAGGISKRVGFAGQGGSCCIIGVVPYATIFFLKVELFIATDEGAGKLRLRVCP